MNAPVFVRIISRPVLMPQKDIDTDQIIPARFLKVTTKVGLGSKLFADLRNAPDFVLNQPASAGAQILVAGENFGCGSSREHAPWALYDYGFRAVISTRIADIFTANALKNGILPIVVSDAFISGIGPDTTLTIDLNAQTLSIESGACTDFHIDPFARYRLLNGVDELGLLLGKDAEIAAYEAR